MSESRFTRMLKVRCTELEASKLSEMAAEAGISQSEIVRRWINEKRIVSRTDSRTVAEMRREGGLLKHLALRLLDERSNMKLAKALYAQGVSVMHLAKKAQESLE